MSRKSSTKSKPKAIIMETEGTTVDSHFFSKTLSPFIKNNLENFLNDAFEWPEVKELIKELRRSVQSSQRKGMPTVSVGDKRTVVKAVVENIRWQMSEHTDSKELKSMRILVWFWGANTDRISTPVYPDVVKCIHKWKQNGVTLCVYSKAMALAQKLLFVKTNKGNLNFLIDHFFDSNIGSKDDPQSFKAIAKAIGCDTNKVLLITAKTEEAEVAINAGMDAVVIERPPKTVDAKNVRKIKSFEEI